MKNISDATDLIATAREALLEELLPRIPKEQRYAGLMIANAMAIALREQRSNAQVTRDELARLRALLPAVASPAAADTPEELPTLRRALCTEIRAGAFDEGARRHELEVHLARTAANWVAISNPKALRTPQAA